MARTKGFFILILYLVIAFVLRVPRKVVVFSQTTQTHLDEVGFLYDKWLDRVDEPLCASTHHKPFFNVLLASEPIQKLVGTRA